MASSAKKQRFVTLADRRGSRVAIDPSKVEAVYFASAIPGYSARHLVLQLPGGLIELSEDEAPHALGLLGVEPAELTKENVA